MWPTNKLDTISIMVYAFCNCNMIQLIIQREPFEMPIKSSIGPPQVNSF